MATNITTGKVRLSYVHLFTPYAGQNGGEAKYSVCVLIDKADKATLDKLEAAVAEAKAAGKSSKWGGKIPAKLATPLHDGDADYPDDEAYKGKFYLNARNSRKPGVVDRNLQFILDPEEVYSGCYGRVNLTFFPYDSNGNRGIGASLQHVQKLEDGEPLGGGSVSVETAFGDDDDDLLD